MRIRIYLAFEYSKVSPIIGTLPTNVILCRRLLKIVGVDEVAYDELIEEISVRREDEAYAWADLKPKIIAALIEVFQEAVMSHQLAKMSHNSGMTHHSIKDAYHLDNLSVRWDREDGIIDNIISAGLKPVLNQTNSGKYLTPFDPI